MAQWTIDPDHSVAAFSVRHMMIANVRGQFNRITGRIVFDQNNIAGSSVEMTIDVSSITTGIRKRYDHLLSPDFFDADLFPFITFRSSGAKLISGNRAIVSGSLTLRGISKDVTLDVEFNGPEKDPFGTGVSMGFTASVRINREDFGMIWNQPMGCCELCEVQVLPDQTDSWPQAHHQRRP